MHARRHQEVARSLRRGGGEDRRLELEEAQGLHPLAQRIDDPAAQHDIGVQLLAAQIEEAIAQPRLLRIGKIAEHRQRQLGRRAQHLDLGHIDLDQAGRHVRVLGACGALAHLAVESRDPFGTQLLRVFEGRRVGIDHALGEAVMVAQIDEQNPAVVANAVAPAGEPYFLAGMGLARLSTIMRTIAMHLECLHVHRRDVSSRGEAQGEGAVSSFNGAFHPPLRDLSDSPIARRCGRPGRACPGQPRQAAEKLKENARHRRISSHVGLRPSLASRRTSRDASTRWRGLHDRIVSCETWTPPVPRGVDSSLRTAPPPTPYTLRGDAPPAKAGRKEFSPNVSRARKRHFYERAPLRRRSSSIARLIPGTACASYQWIICCISASAGRASAAPINSAQACAMLMMIRADSGT